MTGVAPSMGALRVALFELQDDRCAICGGKDPRLVVDHDHCTGLVRGLLCSACNVSEGHHGECEYFERCAVCWYRVRPPVSWLGWTVRYESSWGGIANSVASQPLLSQWVPGCIATRKRRVKSGGLAIAAILDGGAP